MSAPTITKVQPSNSELNLPSLGEHIVRVQRASKSAFTDPNEIDALILKTDPVRIAHGLGLIGDAPLKNIIINVLGKDRTDWRIPIPDEKAAQIMQVYKATAHAIKSADLKNLTLFEIKATATFLYHFYYDLSHLKYLFSWCSNSDRLPIRTIGFLNLSTGDRDLERKPALYRQYVLALNSVLNFAKSKHDSESQVDLDQSSSSELLRPGYLEYLLTRPYDPDIFRLVQRILDNLSTSDSHHVPIRAILHDIFGPFAGYIQIPILEAWKTGTVLGLAKTMYEAKTYDRMPILADALEDAGCNDSIILAHCRDEKTLHVHGCWLIEAILNKSEKDLTNYSIG